jgi:hypothetical protein
MNESCPPETCPTDAERRHDKVREGIIDVLSLATAFAVVWRYSPDGILATIVVAAGASFAGHIAWRLLWVMSAPLLAMLTMVIYLSTIMQATSFTLTGVVLAMFVPGIAQIYVIRALWAATGTLLHPLTLMCTAWLVLLGITIYEQHPFGHWRPWRTKGTSLC